MLHQNKLSPPCRWHSYHSPTAELLKSGPQWLHVCHLFHPLHNSHQISSNRDSYWELDGQIQKVSGSLPIWPLCIISHCRSLCETLCPPDFNDIWLSQVPWYSPVFFSRFSSLYTIFFSWVGHSKGFSYHEWFRIKISSIHISTQQTCKPDPYEMSRQPYTR